MTNKSIPGPGLPGFWGIFDGDFGDPETESPMRTVTPSSVGSSLLPFRCPKCQVVAQELACPVTREHYRDKRPGRTNHFCPSCSCRLKIDLRGTPLTTTLPAGAVVGPSKVESGGEVAWQDLPEGTLEGIAGFVLGLFGAPSKSAVKTGYAVLASPKYMALESVASRKR